MAIKRSSLTTRLGQSDYTDVIDADGVVVGAYQTNRGGRYDGQIGEVCVRSGKIFGPMTTGYPSAASTGARDAAHAIALIAKNAWR